MPSRPLSDEQLSQTLDILDEVIAEGFSFGDPSKPAATEAASRAVARGIVRTDKAYGTRLGAARKRFPERDTAQRGLASAPSAQPAVAPTKIKLPERPRIEPRAAGTRVFILTAAQDQTGVHEAAWANLKAYAEHRDAEIMVGGFTYQKGLFEDHSVETNVFATAVTPYLCPTVEDLAPGLVWYGKANVLPTAVDPLSGWDTQTRDKWMIIPHAKIALKCIPTMPGKRPKQIMTTGVITQPNYVQRNAGQKAEFHHTIGALVVEVAPDGVHFCRQLNCRSDGSFQDLDMIVAEGRVTDGHRIESLTAGDIHVEMLDGETALGTWGINSTDLRQLASDGIIDVLRPHYQFVHDTYDFTPRSHHTRNDPHEKALRIAEGQDEVFQSIRKAAEFLQAIHRPFCQTVNVAANHLFHLDYWLKDSKGAEDAVNAWYWHRLNAAWHDAIRAGDDEFMVHEYAMRMAAGGDGLDGVTFLREGQSFVTCQTTSPIENGLHGDRGPRGSRGSLANLAKIVERVNIGHTHAPGIRESAYQAGTSGRRDPRFAVKSPTTWMPAHILSYPSGKRAIVTMDGPRWRA
jgi:hypothetical protein